MCLKKKKRKRKKRNHCNDRVCACVKKTGQKRVREQIETEVLFSKKNLFIFVFFQDQDICFMISFHNYLLNCQNIQ